MSLLCVCQDILTKFPNECNLETLTFSNCSLWLTPRKISFEKSGMLNCGNIMDCRKMLMSGSSWSASNFNFWTYVSTDWKTRLSTITVGMQSDKNLCISGPNFSFTCWFQIIHTFIKCFINTVRPRCKKELGGFLPDISHCHGNI